MAKGYVPTHIRYSPWLIGVMAGFFFVEAKKRPVRIPYVRPHLIGLWSSTFYFTFILRDRKIHNESPFH